MNIQNKFINISGTSWGIGSQTVTCSLLVVESGVGVFVPVNLTDLK